MNLQWTSLMSEVMEPFCRELASYLSSETDGTITFSEDPSFEERRQLMAQQAIDLAWICGVDYVTAMGGLASGEWSYEPLVAACYGNDPSPRYHSDLIVHNESPYQAFADLRHASFAYNEVESFSGYKIMCAHLAHLGEVGPFFGGAVKSGSHISSMQMVRQGQADAAAIDSTVMRVSGQTAPEGLADLRVIEKIGPYPMPPLVISQACPKVLKEQLRAALASMHQNRAGRELLNPYQIGRFAQVDDSYYNPIRACLEESHRVILSA